MIGRTKRDKSHTVRGALLGVLLGAFLPDQFNPVVIVRNLVRR